MSTDSKVIHDIWDSYFTDRHDVSMTISFDDAVTQGEPPAGLDLCARVIIPISETNPDSSWPVDTESELLYAMEDEITEQLQAAEISCRLVGRMTYDGLRELVFQVGDPEEFRPIVGRWMQTHNGYEIDVSEHDGWVFFDDFVRPTGDDRRNMAEQRVIDNLIENGSDPNLPHELEYCFRGDHPTLEKISKALTERDYALLKDQDLAEGRVVLSKSMILDRQAIRNESDANAALAQQLGGDLDGWGAAVVTANKA